MALLVTVGALALILCFGICGFLRDLPRGILVLTGVLFGAALVSFWAAPLASDLSQRLNNPDVALLQRFSSIVLCIAATGFLGFGTGLLFPKITGTTPLFRTVGALLGVFSGCLMAGFLIIYACYENPAFLAQVQQSAIGVLLYQRVSTLLAGGGLVVAVAVSIVGISQMLARRDPQPESKGVTHAGVAAQQATLDKIKERLGS